MTWPVVLRGSRLVTVLPAADSRLRLRRAADEAAGRARRAGARCGRRARRRRPLPAAPSRTLTAEVGGQRLGRRAAAARPAAGRPGRARVGAARGGRAVRPAGLHLRRARRRRDAAAAARRTASSSTAGPTACSKRSPACRSTRRSCASTLTGCASAPEPCRRARVRSATTGGVGDRIGPRDGVSCTGTRGARPWRLVAVVHREADATDVARRVSRFQQQRRCRLPRPSGSRASDADRVRSAARAVAGRDQRDARAGRLQRADSGRAAPITLDGAARQSPARCGQPITRDEPRPDASGRSRRST